jgi:acetyl esterase/lipase
VWSAKSSSALASEAVARTVPAHVSMDVGCDPGAHAFVIRRVGLAVCAVAVVSALAAVFGSGSSRAVGGLILRGPFGSGANAVWLLLPRSHPRSVVVFLHGWKVAPPEPSHPWVGQFRPWLDHLVADGSAVLFPAYQLGGDTQSPARVSSLRIGLGEGFSQLNHPGLPVVAAGYSFGASLAFYYAADARRWRLPGPRAVDAIFPAGPIPGAPLPRLPAGVDVLLQVGDEDTVAGRSGADAFWSWLIKRRGGRQRLVVVRSSPGFAAVHAAPKLSSAPARRAFWAPLDTLLRQDARS